VLGHSAPISHDLPGNSVAWGRAVRQKPAVCFSEMYKAVPIVPREHQYWLESIVSFLDFGHQNPRNTQCDDESNKYRLHDLDTSLTCNDTRDGRKEGTTGLRKDEDES
jgi:hypothetical protein